MQEKRGIVESEQPERPSSSTPTSSTGKPFSLNKSGASADCCGGRCRSASARTQDAVANAVRNAVKR